MVRKLQKSLLINKLLYIIIILGVRYGEHSGNITAKGGDTDLEFPLISCNFLNI
jgi:hypothetical protein